MLRIARPLVIAAAVIGYPLLAHYTNEHAHSEQLGAVLSVAPVLTISFVLAWNSARRHVMLGATVLACFALMTVWPLLLQHYGVVYWLDHVGMQLVLLMTFAITLSGGRQPLCTRLAEAVHPPLTPAHEIYARKVTVAWSLFFAAMALTSTLLFFLAPMTVWSIFANFMTLPLVALMFVAEYRVRKYALPEVKNIHILDAVRAFRAPAR
ncbi:MAG: hypothetical protein PHP85_08535 [Gallionella sp.]|nr:hypothetical protein [Gallionella sp.]